MNSVFLRRWPWHASTGKPPFEARRQWPHVAIAALAGGLLLAATGTRACGADGNAFELRVVSSGGSAAAVSVLARRYEKEFGLRIDLQQGPSMGQTSEAIPKRLARNEPIDVVVMVGSALDQLASAEQVERNSTAIIAESRIACAVPLGDPVPDISTVARLKAALLDAHAIAWSDSASGEYLSKQLFNRLGIESQVLAKGKRIEATPVGEVLARREADFGCQQRSELQPIAGISIAGDLPPSVQRVTTYAAAVVIGSAHAAQARRFIAYLTSPESASAIHATGLAPMAQANSH